MAGVSSNAVMRLSKAETLLYRSLKLAARAFEKCKEPIALGRFQAIADRAFNGLSEGDEYLRINARSLCNVVQNTIGMPTKLSISGDEKRIVLEELKSLSDEATTFSARSVIANILEPRNEYGVYREPILNEEGDHSRLMGYNLHLRRFSSGTISNKPNYGLTIETNTTGKIMSISCEFPAKSKDESIANYSLKELDDDSPLLQLVNKRVKLINQYLKANESGPRSIRRDRRFVSNRKPEPASNRLRSRRVRPGINKLKAAG